MSVVKESEKPAFSVDAASRSETIVLKFGSSVLRELDDLTVYVAEIYRHARHGVRVVAVVSAFAGETDALIDEANALGASKASRHAPRLIALGEERAAALLALACDRAGLDARIAGPRQIDLRAGGDIDDAAPRSVDVNGLLRLAARHDVVIVPGFVALGETGEPVLLGRGGSDLTAVFIAEQLGVGEVTLLKDVPGIFDRDPAEAGDAAQFFSAINWSEARKVAGKLVQPKAISFAEGRGVGINIARAGAATGSRIGAVATTPAATPQAVRLRVGVAGLGVVGGGVAARLANDNPDFELAASLIRDLSKPRDDLGGAVVLTSDVDAFLAAASDIVIDALPDGAAGRALIEAALGRGVSVVTANKQAIAGGLAALTELARANGANLCYAASVGGGAPAVETVRRAAAAGDVHFVEGILNGTVNYILSAMAAGVSFDDAIRAAQAAGLAEPDPTADLSGDDARAKLSILSFEAFGEEIAPTEIACEPLTRERAEHFAKSGARWKQIARLEKREGGPIVANVSYKQADDSALFRRVIGEGNAIRAVNRDGRVFSCAGKGAGRAPTVESLLADLGDIRRSRG